MYHYADGDVSRGPVEKEALRGRITRETLVWREGMPEWVAAGTVPELADVLPPVAPEPLVAAPVTHAPDYAPPPNAPPTGGYGQPYGQQNAPQHVAHGGPMPMQYQSHYAMPQAAPGSAVASLVLGIVGIFGTFCYGSGLICSILAIIFGHVARANGAIAGRPGAGMAIAGIIMGWIMIALGVLGILIFFVAIAASAAAVAAGN